jgi:hypothetical protein
MRRWQTAQRLGRRVTCIGYSLYWLLSSRSRSRQPWHRLFYDKDCSDFPTQKAAQKYFKKHGGPRHDPSRLDADHDGIACEDNRKGGYRHHRRASSDRIEEKI